MNRFASAGSGVLILSMLLQTATKLIPAGTSIQLYRFSVYERGSAKNTHTIHYSLTTRSIVMFTWRGFYVFILNSKTRTFNSFSSLRGRTAGQNKNTQWKSNRVSIDTSWNKLCWLPNSSSILLENRFVIISRSFDLGFQSSPQIRWLFCAWFCME